MRATCSVLVLFSAWRACDAQTAVREIKLLALLRHENIVRLEHIVTPPKADREAGDTIYMVFECLLCSIGIFICPVIFLINKADLCP